MEGRQKPPGQNCSCDSASANSTGSSEAGDGPSELPELGQEDQVLILQYRPVIGHRLPPGTG